MGKMGKDKSSVVKKDKKSKKKELSVEGEQKNKDILQNEQDLDEASSSSSCSSAESEDDENAVLVTAETEAEVLSTVALLRAKDPRIYQKEIQLYDDSKLDKAEKVWKSQVESKSTKKESLTLRGIYQKNILIGNATEEIIGDSNNNDESEEQIKVEAYDEYSFKNEFKNAFAGQQEGQQEEEEGEGDDLLVLKEKSNDILEREDREYKEFLFQSLSADKVTSQTANDWFSLKDDMNEDDKFLINYVLNRGWIERTASSKKEAEPVSLEDDEQDLEKTDQF